MLDIAMRLETRGGTHTEATGETNSVFDVTVTVGEGDSSGSFSEHGGRLTLPATQGLSLGLTATASGELPQPTEGLLLPVEKGMFADNPLLADGDIAGAVTEVVVNRNAPRVAYTFLGVDAVRTAIAELRHQQEDHGYRATQVLQAAEFVLERTQVLV